MNAPAHVTDLARLLQAFFCQYLIEQRGASRQTVSAYRDTFRLLLRFAEAHCGKSVAELALADLDAALVLAFLDDLETQRHNTARTRNARLAAIRAFVHYAGLQEPAALPKIQQILAIPAKRFDRPLVGFLSRGEIEAILAAPDGRTWNGQHDRALLTVLYNTGARVSEIITVRRVDVACECCQAIHLHGKGRKERAVPLWRRATQLIRDWLPRIGPEPQQPLFPNRRDQAMTRSGVTSRLDRAVRAATAQCPSLASKQVSPHWIRHTTAMHLLQAGVDLTVIALWLGHEGVATTHQYVEADLRMKERALAALQPPAVGNPRFVPSPTLLAFLDGL
jgi:site-specific recombinase XerD